MARLFLSSGENYSTVGAGANEVFGFASGAESVHVAGNGDAIFDATFNQGGDTIYIDGNAADYRVVLDGTSRILLTSLGGASINIPVGGVGANIVFNDAERVLKFVGSSAKLGDQTVTSTAAAVEAGGSPPNLELFLEVSRDNLVGGSGDDTFVGDIVQNGAGEQSNTLGTGDRLNGKGGDDTLIGTIQDASALNDTPGSSIAPIIRDVEDIQLTAFQAYDGIDENVEGEGLGIATGVGINAKSIFGVDRLGSFHSDTSMTYYNVNTLLDNSDLGDEEGARRTSAITIRMERTGPASPLNDVADFTVLFDNDYLLRAPNTSAGATIRIQMMDLDSALNGLDPLLNNPYNSFQFTIGGELVTLPINLTTGTTYEAVRAGFQAALNANPLTAGKVTAVLGPVFTANDTDSDPGGSAEGVEILLINSGSELLVPVRFNADDGVPTALDFHLQTFEGQATETSELITSIIELEKVGNLGDGGYLTVGGMAVVGSDHYYDSLLENTWQYGAIPRPGVEKFIVHVEGIHNAVVDESSSLAGLQSTHNALQWVEIDNPGSTADLTIGNSQTHDITGVNGATFTLDHHGKIRSNYDDAVDVSSGRNNAVKDVLVFDASEFTAKSTVWAILTDEFVDKYTYLADFQILPRADNSQGSTGIEANYDFGSGDNTFNINISKSNAAFLGNATREDFELNIDTNGGDDHVQLQIGNGSDWKGHHESGHGDVVSWYNNHAINAFGYVGGVSKGNDRYKDMQIIVNTGDDDDFVETWGSTTAYVKLGEGDDIVYTDNSGEWDTFNEGHATWVFNALEDGSTVNDLSSFTRAETARIANLGITVTFQDIEVRVPVIVGGTNGAQGAFLTDLSIVQALKDAINNDPALSDVLVALDGPGRTLLVLSKIDGRHVETDLSVSLFDTGVLSASQIAAGAVLMSTWLSNPANSAAFGFVNSGGIMIPTTTGVDGDRWDAEFGQAGYKGKKYDLEGEDSQNTNNNVVEDSTGDDTIVLSSFGGVGCQVSKDTDIAIRDVNFTFGSVETIDINGPKTDHNIVYNFTAGEPEFDIAEVQTILIDGELPEPHLDGTTPDVSHNYQVTVYDSDNNPTVINVPYGGVGEPDTDVELAVAVAAAINANPTTSTYVVASVVGGSNVQLSYFPAGINFSEATAVLVGNPHPPQDEFAEFTFNGDELLRPGIISVAFGDIATGNLAIGTTTSNDDNHEVAQLVADWFSDADNDPLDIVSAEVSGDTITLTYNLPEDVASPFVSIDQGAGSVGTLTYLVGESGDFQVGLESDVRTDLEGYEAEDIGGWDIFDLTTVMGPANPLNFINEQAAHTLEPDGVTYNEPGDIAFATNNGGTIAIIDTVDPTDYAFVGTPADELARITQIARDADVAHVGAVKDSVVITVDADNTGTFYHISNGNGANDVTVTRLGAYELAEYDDQINKDPIGDWDQMTIINFTPLTAETVIDTFTVV